MHTLSSTVAAYLDDRRSRGEIGDKTLRDLRSRLAGLVAVAGAELAIADLDRDRIRDWQRSIGHHRPACRRAYLSSVRVFCGWAIAEGFLAGDPTAGAGRVREPRRDPRALSAGQVARLRLVLPDLQARVMVSLMLGCGLRCVEVSRLSLGDYDADGRTLRVVGKNSDERLLPVPGATAAVIDEAMGSGWLGLSAGRISALVSGWMTDAGIKSGPYDGVSAHALRHTFASDMLDRCGNVRTVQEALGHVSLATTQRYLRRASLDQMRAAMDGDWQPAA